MSLLISDGMDGIIPIEAGWDVAPASLSHVADSGKYGSGTRSAKIGTADQSCSKSSGVTNAAIGSTTNPIHIAFFIKLSSNPTASKSIIELHDDMSLNCVRLFITSSGILCAAAFAVLNYGYLTLISSTNITDGVWHHIEFKFIAHNSTGLATLWLDGVQVGSFSGDTMDISTVLSANGITRLKIVAPVADTDFDDIIVWDESGSEFAVTGQYGPHRLEALSPNGAGSSTQFTVVGAASNYLAVNDGITDYESTYVESSTTGHLDLYAYSNLAGSPSVISGVIVSSMLTNPYDSIIQAKHAIKSSTTTAYEAASVVPSTVWGVKSDFVHVDPNTSTAWTESGVNAAEFGLEVI